MLDGAGKKFLGIEGGGTRTTALLASGNGEVLGRAYGGPANVKLLSDTQLTQIFRYLASALPWPDALAVGLAGAWMPADRRRILQAAGKVWPGVPCYATHDLETAITAGPQDKKQNQIPLILIVSGTGSCCYGQTATGQEMKVGGWGHILGDKGSGYEIGLNALKALLLEYDRTGVWPPLGRRLLCVLQLNEPTDLVNWAATADKAHVASLAPDVFNAWNDRDRLADRILAGAAASLAADAVTCARRLHLSGKPVRFILAGSTLLKQPRFARKLASQLRNGWPTARIGPLQREGVWGAVELAKRFYNQVNVHVPPLKPTPRAGNDAVHNQPLVRSSRMSPTERRNPRSMRLDRMRIEEAVALMLQEEAKVPRKLLAEREKISQAINLIARSFKRGGRLFYVGAGTSGRLGVLDASECPPTFRTPPQMVQGVIAGGQTALWKSTEGAEDNTLAGTQSMILRDVGARDVVVGIAASGRTPFVWAALAEARRRRAATVLICFNPYLEIPRALAPKIVIAPNLGPEVLTGSTRLKAGTATKLILNLFTTLAMARSGKVMSNLMIDLHPANEKLRDRAARIVQELTGADLSEARRALEQSRWLIKKAISRLARKPKLRASETYPINSKR